MHASKRIVAIVFSLVAVALRRFNLSPEDLAILLDAVEAVLAVGLGSHYAREFYRARTSKHLAKIGLVLALAGCTTTQLTDCVVDVSKSDPAKDRLRCKDHEPIAIPRMDPALRQCVLGAKP